MMYYPNINPELINFYGISIKWYGFCHVIAFMLFYWRAMATKPNNLTNDNISDLTFYLCLGILLGGKIGYIIFYSPGEIFKEHINLLKFWSPGRSFHGGLLGAIVGVYLYSKRFKLSFWDLSDFISPIVPIGIFFGRLGNFMNGELWGRVTSVPWGMVFRHVDNLPRHPSQIYEMTLEGLLLFIILNFGINLKFLHRYYKITWNTSGLFLIFYAIFRILIENYREPDLGQGIGFLGMTMGQILSIPMLVIGILILCFRYNHYVVIHSKVL